MVVSRVILKKQKIKYKNLSKENAVGFAYKEDNLIEIEPNQSDRELFLTVCHELAHNLLPDLSEKQIVKLEKTFGVSLWNVVLRLRRKWKKNF
jgi:Zn-dependent peptidase ImmA (M78 family)